MTFVLVWSLKLGRSVRRPTMERFYKNTWENKPPNRIPMWEE